VQRRDRRALREEDRIFGDFLRLARQDARANRWELMEDRGERREDWGDRRDDRNDRGYDWQRDR
jgi:hypothetical protein